MFNRRRHHPDRPPDGRARGRACPWLAGLVAGVYPAWRVCRIAPGHPPEDPVGERRGDWDPILRAHAPQQGPLRPASRSRWRSPSRSSSTAWPSSPTRAAKMARASGFRRRQHPARRQHALRPGVQGGRLPRHAAARRPGRAARHARRARRPATRASCPGRAAAARPRCARAGSRARCCARRSTTPTRRRFDTLGVEVVGARNFTREDVDRDTERLRALLANRARDGADGLPSARSSLQDVVMSRALRPSSCSATSRCSAS